MRILQVIARLDPGGAEDIVVRLAGAARDAGHEVAVASAPGRWVDRLQDVGATYLPVVEPAPGRAATAGLSSLRRALRWEPTLVHTHNVKMTAATRVALGFGDRPPVLATVHGLTPERYRVAAPILRRTADFVVACAPAVATQLVAAGFPVPRLTTVLNGARRSKASDERVDALRARWGLDAGPIVVGVGRLVPQKAWGLLIEALAGVPDVSLVIAGEGPERPLLESAMRKHRVQGVLPGHVDDVDALLGLATVVCQTSSWEGLPLSLLEAASAGCTIVARNVDGVADALGPETALLVDGDDPADFRRAIRSLLGDDAARHRLAATASEAAHRWSPERMAAAYLDLYVRPLRGGSGR
jgi:glycosyltransferase involved in cell wall biosynthesis